MTIPQKQGREVPMDEMPPWEESKLKTYPMVWHNEVTGKPAFMVHAIIAQKLLLKTTPDAQEQVISDVDEVRAWLYNISRRMIEPENILVADYEEGDIAVWNNRVSSVALPDQRSLNTDVLSSVHAAYVYRVPRIVWPKNHASGQYRCFETTYVSA